ncbi:MAG: lauroyl acyltransferase [Rhodobacteraceae bacterium]|nr:lauroyl acyltransferase [Paracoccaceae bacterium]
MTPNAPTLRHHIEATLLKWAIALFRLIPVDAASWAMGKLWRLFAPLNPRHKRALGHLEMALPETTEAERQKILSEMWENLGRVAAETFFIRELVNDPTRFELDMDETAQKVLDGKTNTVLVSMHSGNWELCVQPTFVDGVPIAGIYQALKNPLADDVLSSMRRDLYPLGLLSKGYETARKIIGLVRGGGTIAIMGDLRENRGVTVNFFGQEATATPVPATLARTNNVPLIAGRVIRTKGARFRIEARVVEITQTDDKKHDIQQLTQKTHEIFEGWIRERPGQWMWIIRKWRK